jgi:hypothetical protein
MKIRHDVTKYRKDSHLVTAPSRIGHQVTFKPHAGSSVKSDCLLFFLSRFTTCCIFLENNVFFLSCPTYYRGIYIHIEACESAACGSRGHWFMVFDACCAGGRISYWEFHSRQHMVLGLYLSVEVIVLPIKHIIWSLNLPMLLPSIMKHERKKR